MEGDLKAIPLTEVLELVHAHRRSGVLEVRTGPLPLTLRFALGEVVGASILDWEGPDALFAFPLHPEEGVFRFVPKRPPEAAQALMPFSVLLGEWARVNDEWDRFRTLIDSPSRVLEAIRPGEPYGAFLGGKSVRAAAKAWGVPLIIAMERAYMGVREGDLYPLRRYSWFALRIRHVGRKTKTLEEFGHLAALLDGSRNLGEIVAEGVPLGLVRRYLIRALAQEELTPRDGGGSSGTCFGKPRRRPNSLLLLPGPVLAVGAAPDLAAPGPAVALAHTPSLGAEAAANEGRPRGLGRLTDLAHQPGLPAGSGVLVQGGALRRLVNEAFGLAHDLQGLFRLALLGQLDGLLAEGLDGRLLGLVAEPALQGLPVPLKGGKVPLGLLLRHRSPLWPPRGQTRAQCSTPCA